MMEELADERSSFQAALSRATRKVMACSQRSNHNQRPFLRLISMASSISSPAGGTGASRR